MIEISIIIPKSVMNCVILAKELTFFPRLIISAAPTQQDGKVVFSLEGTAKTLRSFRTSVLSSC